MVEEKHKFADEPVPLVSPLRPLESKTISKGFGWWAAVVLFEGWGRKQIGLYLWQRKGDRWARKQKFTIHTQEQWSHISEAVESIVAELP